MRPVRARHGSAIAGPVAPGVSGPEGARRRRPCCGGRRAGWRAPCSSRGPGPWGRNRASSSSCDGSTSTSTRRAALPEAPVVVHALGRRIGAWRSLACVSKRISKGPTLARLPPTTRHPMHCIVCFGWRIGCLEFGGRPLCCLEACHTSPG